MTPLLASNFSFHQKDHKSTVKSSLREIWQCYNLTNNFYTVKPLLRYSYICITLWDRHSHVNLSIMQRQQVAFPYFSMTLLAALLRSNRMVNNVPFSSRPHTLTTSKQWKVEGGVITIAFVCALSIRGAWAAVNCNLDHTTKLH